MSCFAADVASIYRTLNEVAGIPVTYHRAGNWVRLRAVPGESRFDLIDEEGVAVQSRSRDYVIPACDLTLDDEPLTPQRGDYVHEEDSGEDYEVMTPDGGEQVWRFSDVGRTAIRIHTKRREQ